MKFKINFKQTTATSAGDINSSNLLVNLYFRIKIFAAISSLVFLGIFHMSRIKRKLSRSYFTYFSFTVSVFAIHRHDFSSF